MARLFLAVPAHGLEKEFEPWMRKLRIGEDRKSLDIRWVPAELRHITVFFFGDVPASQEQTLKQTIARSSADIEQFALKIEKLGAFPEARSARVIWLGVQNSKKLRALHESLAQPLRELGFSIEEDYSPHLTIGRLRSAKSVTDFISPFAHVRLEKLPVRELVLYESIQTGPFSTYQIRARFPLRPVASEDQFESPS